jgi:argininosuccinate lyase
LIDPSGPLWSGRIQGDMAGAMVPLNRSLDVDMRLWPQDVQGSRGGGPARG